MNDTIATLFVLVVAAGALIVTTAIAYLFTQFIIWLADVTYDHHRVSEFSPRSPLQSPSTYQGAFPMTIKINTDDLKKFDTDSAGNYYTKVTSVTKDGAFLTADGTGEVIAVIGKTDFVLGDTVFFDRQGDFIKRVAGKATGKKDKQQAAPSGRSGSTALPAVKY